MIEVQETPLTDEQVESYRSEGFLVMSDLLTPDEVDAFLEHEARPRPQEWTDGLRTHTANPARRRLATHPRIVGVVRQLLGAPPQVVQTMLLDKPSGGGRGIALHQDTYYIPNEPNTLMACWVALADADESNGGLCVAPGSHRGGLRGSHANRNAEEHAVWETQHQMRDRDGRQWTHSLAAAEIDDLDPASVRRLTVPRGAGVFFTGLTIHGSFANRSTERRRPAFAIHYVAGGTWVFRTDIQELVPAG